jgi:chemotaxis protein histidine kinase CheA
MKRAGLEIKRKTKYLKYNNDNNNEIATKKTVEEEEEEEEEEKEMEKGEKEEEIFEETKEEIFEEGKEKKSKNKKAKGKNVSNQKNKYKKQIKDKKKKKEAQSTALRAKEECLEKSLDNHTEEKSKNNIFKNNKKEKKNQNGQHQKKKKKEKKEEQNTNQIKTNKKRKREDPIECQKHFKSAPSQDQEKNKKEQFEEKWEKTEEEEKNSRELCAKLRKLNSGEAWKIIPEEYKSHLIDYLEGVISNKRSLILEIPYELLLKIVGENVEAYAYLRITCNHFYKLLPDYYALHIKNGDIMSRLSLAKNNIEHILPCKEMIHFVYRMINRIKKNTGKKYIINQKKSFEHNATHFLIELPRNTEEQELPGKKKKSNGKFRIQKKTGLIVNLNSVQQPRGLIDMKSPEDLFKKEDGRLISVGDLIRSKICTKEFLSKIQMIHYKAQFSKKKEDDAVYRAVIRI